MLTHTLIDMTRYDAGDEIEPFPNDPGATVSVDESKLDTLRTSALPVRGRPAVLTATGTLTGGANVISGVVLETPETAGDIILLQRKGVFAMTVIGANNGGNVALAAGAPVYMETGVGTLNGDNADGVLFGWLLTPVASGDTSLAAVVLRA